MGVLQRTKWPQNPYAGWVETIGTHTSSAQSFVFCHVFSKPLLPCSILEMLRAVSKNRWRSSRLSGVMEKVCFPMLPGELPCAH